MKPPAPRYRLERGEIEILRAWSQREPAEAKRFRALPRLLAGAIVRRAAARRAKAKLEALTGGPVLGFASKPLGGRR